MLALTRKKGEALVINNNIEITVLEIRGDQIKIGISAPKRCTNLPKRSIFTDPAGKCRLPSVQMVWNALNNLLD